MKNLVENPFKFGSPVSGDYYFSRPELTGTVKNFLANRIHVVLMGPRRFGKTSFVLDLFQLFEHEGYTCLMVDIFNVTSHRDFLNQLLRALKKKQNLKSRLVSLKKNVTRLRPQLNVDVDPQTGSLNSSIGISLESMDEEEVKSAVQDLLDDLALLGDKVVVSFDEFQQMSQLEDRGWLEATVRTHMQKLTNVSFLLTGSRKSLISDMLNDPARPLYRSCQIIEFPSFGANFTDWVISRFKMVGITCSQAAINHLRALVQDTPNYVQMVCFHIVASARPSVGIEDVEEVLNMVAKQNAYAYQTLLNTLTLPQVRALRLAAHEKQALFGQEMLVKYEISSAPALHNSIKALKVKGILDEEGTAKGRVLFDDPLFAYWLRLEFPN